MKCMLMLLAPALLLVAAEERVPYADDLTEGQGYNTFLQAGCMHDAVKITTETNDIAPKHSGSPSAPVSIVYTAEKITEFEKLAQSIDVSVGLTVSGEFGEGKTTAKFLDRSEFESSFLTYLVKVDIQRQPAEKREFSMQWNESASPHEAYCDRFIGDFIKGGALFARVSITTKDKTKHREVEQSAEAAFNAYGINTNVSESIKASFDNIQKHSKIRVDLHYVGAPPEVKKEVKGDDQFIQLKNTADEFLAQANQHDWKRYALLEKYTNIPGYNNQFQPLDYSEAKNEGWSSFLDFTHYLSVQTTIRKIPEEHFAGGRTKRNELEDRSTKTLETFRAWVASIVQDPLKARQRPLDSDPSAFRGEVLQAVTPVRYIAQHLNVAGRAGSDILHTELQNDATELFTVEAFNFPDIPGTTNVIFGKIPDDEQYECLVGRAISPGFDLQAELWVFDKPVAGVTDARVEVTTVPELSQVELRFQSKRKQSLESRATSLFGRASKLFSRQGAHGFHFYVKSAQKPGKPKVAGDEGNARQGKNRKEEEECENCV